MMTGQRIRDLRKEKRLSQTELADVVHVSQQTIGKMTKQNLLAVL